MDVFSSTVIDNEGSTARDFLAQERNYLAYVRLAITLTVMGGAFITRLRLVSAGKHDQTQIHRQYSFPLGIILFVFAFLATVHSTSHFFLTQRKLRQRVSFATSTIVSDLALAASALLIGFCCIALFVWEHD